MTKLKDSGISWIGEIPEHWKIASIKNLMFLFSGATPKSDNPSFWGGDVIWITPADYISENHYVNQGRRNITTEGYTSCATTLVPINSLIFSKRAPIGEVALSGVPLCTNQGCIACIPKDKVHSNYYYYTFWIAKKEFDTFGSGTTFLEISTSDFSNFKIPVPPLAEQERIATYLDEKCGEIDELIDVEQQMISDLESYRQAVITEAVTHGLNPATPMKHTSIDWIGEIPEHWEIVRFKSRFSLRKGLTITKADLVESGLPVINYGQIHSKQNSGTSVSEAILKYIPSSFIDSDKQSLVNRGDFIFADTSEDKEGCGNCVYIDCDREIFAGYHSIIASSETDNEYFAYLFLTDVWRSQIRKRVTGIKVYSVSQSMLANTELLVPPTNEQKKIANFLDTKCGEIDSLIKVKQEKIETLKQYRQSLIFEAVTGKITIA